MLQNIRDNIQGLVAKIIIAIIIVPFAIFGVESLVGGGSSPEVAKVNGDKITEMELQRAISAQKRQVMAMYGDRAQPDMLDDAKLRGPVLDSLISQHLLQQSADDLKLRIPTQAVDQTIMAMNAFQQDGKFSPQRYQMLLANQGYTPAYFKEMLQQELLINQLHSGLADSDFATGKELQAVAGLLQQERTFRYVLIPLAALESRLTVSDADAQAYYKAHTDQFMRDERVRVAYIDMQARDFFEPVEESVVKAEFDREAAAFKPVTERHAAHILIQPNAKRTDAEAKALAESIEKRLAKGDAFAKLAEEYSDDIGSKNNGGDLGTTTGDTFPPAFEQELAKLKVGEVSPPVKTDAGYHIIKLIDSNTTKAPTFAEKKAEITERLQQDAAKLTMTRAVEKLRDQVFNADNLSGPAKAFNLPVQESGWIDRHTTDPLFGNAKVLAAAFSDDVLKNGNNSDVMEIAPGHYLALRVKEHQAAAPKPFDEVRDQVIAAVKQQQAMVEAKKVAATLTETVDHGEDFDKAAAAQGFTAKSIEKAKRSSSSVADADIVRAAFAMGRPLKGQPLPIRTLPVGNSDIAVVQLEQVIEGEPDSLTPVQRTALRSQLAQSYGSADFAAFMHSIKARAEIKQR